MNPAIYLCIFLPLFLALSRRQNQKRQRAAMMAVRINRKGDLSDMIEIAKRFVGRDCVVYLFDGNTIDGVIEEVSDGALLIKKSGGKAEAINLAYVTRIREYPKNKNGKKKSVVLD